MKSRRKKKKRIRTKDWTEKHEDSFTHDLKRHLRTDTALSETAQPPVVPEDFEPNGLVISHSKKWVFVQWEGKEHLCTIDDRLVEGETTLLAAGDEVLVEGVEGGEGDPVVRAIKPRRSKLSRPPSGHSRVTEQVIAANIDVLMVVAATARPAFKAGLVDRYLIAAEVGGVTAVLCVNKMDLVEEEPEFVAPYRALGLKVVTTSCVTGQGIDEFRRCLSGKTSVFAGPSGAGKSSLLNRLDARLDIVTREVSESTHKGKHTTTASRLYELEEGVRIIDTPGVRQLGLWGVSDAELAFYFPEMEELAVGCRFRDCSHVHEPDCAVLGALESGALMKHRYDSYRRIRAGLDE